MDKSIFELINLIIRNFDSVKSYQGSNTRGSATIEHIASGLVFSLIIGMVSCFVPLFIFANIPVWIFYALIRELIIDREKNRAQPSYAVPAQIIERSVGFVIGVAITIAILCFV